MLFLNHGLEEVVVFPTVFIAVNDVLISDVEVGLHRVRYFFSFVVCLIIIERLDLLLFVFGGGGALSLVVRGLVKEALPMHFASPFCRLTLRATSFISQICLGFSDFNILFHYFFLRNV